MNAPQKRPYRRQPRPEVREAPSLQAAAIAIRSSPDAETRVGYQSGEDFRDAPQIARPDPRPTTRDDPRARAAARTAQLREHGSLNEDATDKYAIPDGYIPDGWDYEWKRRTVLGAEDPSYQVSTARAGWEPVPVDRHPDFMPTGWKGGSIERDGLVLMERPKEISDEARRRDHRNAVNQVRNKEAQLSGTPEGTLSRTADERTAPKIRKGWEAVPIPEA